MINDEQEMRIQSVVAVRKSTGIMYVKGEPVYIFEHMMYNNADESDFVVCYDIDKALYDKSKGTVLEKATEIVEPSMYSSETLLGRIGNAIKSSRKVKERLVYKPALYVSEVSVGVGSLSPEGKSGTGFYEYVPDTLDYLNGKLVRGDKTGIFILLSDIHWGEPVLDLKSIQDSLNNREGDWHEL